MAAVALAADEGRDDRAVLARHGLLRRLDLPPPLFYFLFVKKIGRQLWRAITKSQK